jgi:hypothetical protein
MATIIHGSRYPTDDARGILRRKTAKTPIDTTSTQFLNDDVLKLIFEETETYKDIFNLTLACRLFCRLTTP